MKLLNLLIPLVLLSACFGSGKTRREKADELLKEKRFAEAEEQYWKHIYYRLSVEDRPEWENPYIYLLDIGDLYLKRGDVEGALKHYKLAEDKKVREAWVNDRYRNIARWYEEQGELDEALEHLQEYQAKDPVLFGMMLDRIAKNIVRKQQAEEDLGRDPEQE